ncbi:MAG: sensor histidine kinase [Longimicrobiales bacterium]
MSKTIRLPGTSRLPLAFILVSLVALAAMPVLSSRAIVGYRREVRDVIEPARLQVTQLHLALALGAAALRDLLNTNDTTFAKRYEEAVRQERAAYDRLAPLAARVGGKSAQRFAELRLAETRWHDRISQLLNERPRRPETIQQELADEDLYEQTLVAAANLDAELARSTADMRAQIDRAERLVLILTMGLVTLAVAAGAVAAALSRRLRSYAAAAEHDRRELEAVLKSHARMTRGITHDLKNPLGVILGHAELLEDGVRGELTPQQRESVSRIRSAAESLLELINTLLELARAESGQIHIRTERVELAPLIQDVVQNHRAKAENAGLLLGVQLDPSLGRIQTDDARVAQVLGNLLSNAIKYTPAGRICVRAEPRASGGPDAGPWIAISVEDTGRGIQPDHIEQIFQEFSRLETETKEGTGLGLAIARRIARLLGGDISAQSEPGKGSTFTLWLPRKV